MTADIKSHVLRRDEKGFMGVPFKRLLFAGVGGGMVLIITRFAVGDLAFALALIAFILALVLTSPRGGIPLWQRLLYRVRGSLMLAAARKPNSPIGQLGTLFEVPADLVMMDGGVVFAPPEGEVEADMTEWITFAHADESDHDSGLIFLEKPLEGTLDGR